MNPRRFPIIYPVGASRGEGARRGSGDAVGDTWGIPGFAFELGYVITGTVLLIAVTAIRLCTASVRPVSRGPHRRARPLHPYEAAYTSGGRKRVVATALTVLRAEGAVEAVSGGRVRASGPPALTLGTGLDHALWDAISRSGESKAARLARRPPVRRELRELRDGLQRARLLRTRAVRNLLRLVGLPLWLLLAVGIARLLVEHHRHRPYTILPLALFAGAVVCLLSLIASRESAAGNSSVQITKDEYRHLDPENSPAWTTYGVPGVAFGVALFGIPALKSIDPAFAETAQLNTYLGEVAASTSGRRGGDGGGGSGCSGGGCGSGCGGGGCGG